VKANNVVESGYPRSAYKLSKAAINGWTRILARDLRNGSSDKEKTLFVATVCPGWIKTRMNPNATLPVEEGADTPSWLALEPLERLSDKSGLFWYQRELISW